VSSQRFDITVLSDPLGDPYKLSDEELREVEIAGQVTLTDEQRDTLDHILDGYLVSASMQRNFTSLKDQAKILDSQSRAVAQIMEFLVNPENKAENQVKVRVQRQLCEMFSEGYSIDQFINELGTYLACIRRVQDENNKQSDASDKGGPPANEATNTLLCNLEKFYKGIGGKSAFERFALKVSEYIPEECRPDLPKSPSSIRARLNRQST